MKRYLVFVFFFIYSISFAEEKILVGRIIDLNSERPISFVNIGIALKGVGTISTEQGYFKLKLNSSIKLSDTIYFSHIGYETGKYLVNQMTDTLNIIKLVSNTLQLNEIVISPVKKKSHVFGRNAKGLGLMHYNFYTAYEKDVDDRLSKEIGIQIKPKGDCKLKDLNIHVTSNEFSSLKFRLNLYKIENGNPTEIITPNEIIFEISGQYKGWFKVDLNPYNVHVSKEMGEIVATIQWVQSKKAFPSAKYFGISTSLSPTVTTFFREKSMDVWKQEKQALSFYFNSVCSF